MKRKKWGKFFQKIFHIIKTGTGFKIFLFFFSLILLSSLTVYLIERKINEGFLSFFDSLWWTIVTVSTVGYGDRLPISFWGRAIAIITIFVGIGITGTVTGRIASFLMEKQMKEEKGLSDFTNLKGHFIVCGWKREMNRILYEILLNNQEISPMEIVLLNKASIDDNNALRNDPKLKGIKYINGNPVEEKE
ncbi:MAG: potassium channel family protein, partial [Chitinispirillia bacterium]